jgi:predicted NBD/HSP70 family sugar kinase
MNVKRSAKAIGDLNRVTVLNQIRLNEPISRVELAGKTGLSKKTISLIVDHLSGERLIEEIGKSEVPSGRHRLQLGLRKGARFSAGLIFEQNYMEGIVTDIRGDIWAHEKKEYERAEEQSILRLVTELLDSLRNRAGFPGHDFIGTGFGITGVLHKGEILQTRFPVSVRKLQAAVGNMTAKPVFTDNYARLSLLAEQIRSHSGEQMNAVYLDVGEGVGGAVTLNGLLYGGSKFPGVEFGHMKVVKDGKPCYCGSCGCLESYINEATLVGDFNRLSGQRTGGRMQAPIRTLTELIYLSEHDSLAKGIIWKASEWLGLTIANIINIFAPDKVIIGGYFAKASEEVLEHITLIAKENALVSVAGHTEIAFAELGHSARTLGAAYLPFNELYFR